MAAGGQERKPLLDMAFDIPAGTTQQQGAESAVEAKFLAVVAYEIENGATCFISRQAKPSSELLQEQRWAIGPAQQQ